MFQVARQSQRRHDSSIRVNAEPAIDRSPALAPGKRAITDAMNAGYNGSPDYYGRAVDSALRELDALRATALPAYVAIRRKQDLAPLAKQIELAKSAMQVRHLILCANNHVYALEKAATFKDPMVIWLRERLDRVVKQATKLGVYADAMDMIPQRFVDDTAKKSAGKKTHNTQAPKITHQPPPTTESSLSGTKPAQIRRPANTASPVAARRMARGTGPVTSPAKSPSLGAPSDSRTTGAANLRPGFRPGAR